MSPPPAASSRAAKRKRGSAPASDDPSREVRQRPRPPWHPLPVAELYMVAGLVLALLGQLRVTGARPGLLTAVGLGVLALGVLELTLREHLAGYRSHRALLAVLTAVVVHALLVVVAPFRLVGPRALALDVVVFLVGYLGYDLLWKRGVRRRAERRGAAASGRAARGRRVR